MRPKLRKVGIGVIVPLLIAMGSLMLPSSLGGASTAKACQYSKFRVVWSVAGVYRQTNGQLVDYRYGGQTVRSVPGWTSGGWTKQVMWEWNPLGGLVMMKDASLQYIGCG